MGEEVKCTERRNYKHLSILPFFFSRWMQMFVYLKEFSFDTIRPNVMRCLIPMLFSMFT